MLQSAFFSEPQPLAGTRPATARQTILKAIEKGSYARLAAWGRALFVRNEIDRLNDHLLRDIGLI